jgi:MtN3 and saliva related transmembrane protein
MDGIEYMGFVASGLGALAYLPQVVRTWRTRSARDFSLPTLLMIVAGSGIWIFYGAWRNAPSIWLGNGVVVALTGVILFFKLRNVFGNNS